MVKVLVAMEQEDKQSDEGAGFYPKNTDEYNIWWIILRILRTLYVEFDDSWNHIATG